MFCRKRWGWNLRWKKKSNPKLWANHEGELNLIVVFKELGCNGPIRLGGSSWFDQILL
jgi:hypothetical protein